MKKKTPVEKCSCYGGFDCSVCNPTKYKKPEKTGNDWLAEIMSERVLSGPPDVIPEGWLTLKQMCKQCNVSESAMRVRISRLVESNRLQRKRFRVWTGHQLMLTWHYHPAK